MNEQELAFVMSTRKLTQKVPAPVSFLNIAVVFFKLLAGPENRFHRHWVETLGVENRCLIVIPQNRQLAVFDYGVETFDRVRTVTNDVSETNNLINFEFPNFLHDR